MASPETLLQVWGILTATWPKVMAEIAPDEAKEALFMADLADLRDAELVAATKHLRRTRPSLYPNDNLVAMLREATGLLQLEADKANARAEGERQHQLALEADRRSTGQRLLTALAGTPDGVGPTPGKIPFHAWLRDNQQRIDADPDRLRATQAIVGDTTHSLDDGLRAVILGCLSKAKDIRDERASGQSSRLPYPDSDDEGGGEDP